MLPRERIERAIRARSAAGEPALVAFMTAGFPSREHFREQLAAIGDGTSGADVVEIGVPFTDPMADGATIQRSSQVALRQGVTLEWILAELAGMPRVAAPLLLMGYLNPMLAYGYERLAADSARAGVCGFIIPDLPLDESDELRAALAREGIALVQMVTPVTPPERLARLCAASEGFVYAVTMTGTTGKSAEVPAAALDYLARARAAARVPVCAGFGIRSADQVRRLAGVVDGVVVGSALVEVLERGESPLAFLASLRGKAAAPPRGG
jgi:tryptophan synthase alpha chain